MRAFWVRSKQLLWLVSLSGLTACNVILDIEEPSTGAVDGGVAEPVSNGGSSGSSTNPEDAGTTTADIALWPDWPMPNPSSTGLPNSQSYGAENQGVVTDQVTLLQWQAAVDGEKRSWPEATVYCATLTLDGGGFRLPSRIELLSLVDFSGAIPSIDTRVFANTPASYFWTSSTFVANRSIAWLVNFGTGPGFVSSSELTSVYPVRCVR